MSNQNLLGQTYDQITKQLLGSGTPHFQMLANPMSFNWPVAATGQISPKAYQLMSAAPVYSPVGDFNGIGTSTLFDNYKQIFAHVGFNPSAELKRQLQQLSDEATDAKNAMNKVEADIGTAYNTAATNGGAIFDARYPNGIVDWLAGPGKSYDKDIATAQAKSDRINEEIMTLNEASLPSSLQDALNLIKTPTGKPSDGNAPPGWALVPDGAGTLRWKPSFSISTSSQDWRAQLTNGTIGSKTITLDASKSNDSITKSWAGANASYSTPFWGVYGGGSWSETDISKDDSSVTATIKLESATTVMIQPGEWYDGGFLKQMVAAGNSGTGYEILDPYKATGTDHALFGKDGICSTMVTGLVVAYKPSFEVTMKSSTFKSHEKKINASAGLRIGPFSFGGSGGHYEKNVATTGDKTTVSGGSTSEDPVIIGVTLGFPGTEEP